MLFQVINANSKRHHQKETRSVIPELQEEALGGFDVDKIIRGGYSDIRECNPYFHQILVIIIRIIRTTIVIITKYLRTITQITHTVTNIVQYTQPIFDMIETSNDHGIDTSLCLSRKDLHNIIVSSTVVTNTTIICVHKRRITIIEIITIIIEQLTKLRIEIEAILCGIGYCSYNNIGNSISLYYHINTRISVYIEEISSYTIRSISILINELLTTCHVDVDIYCIPDLVLVNNCLEGLLKRKG